MAELNGYHFRIIEKRTGIVYFSFDDIEQLVIFCMENADVNEEGGLSMNGYPVEIV